MLSPRLAVMCLDEYRLITGFPALTHLPQIDGKHHVTFIPRMNELLPQNARSRNMSPDTVFSWRISLSSTSSEKCVNDGSFHLIGHDAGRRSVPRLANIASDGRQHCVRIVLSLGRGKALPYVHSEVSRSHLE